jgi:hypothetical protein
MTKNLDFYRFVPSKRKEHENIKKELFFVGGLKVTDKKSRIQSRNR